MDKLKKKIRPLQELPPDKITKKSPTIMIRLINHHLSFTLETNGLSYDILNEYGTKCGKKTTQFTAEEVLCMRLTRNNIGYSFDTHKITSLGLIFGLILYEITDFEYVLICLKKIREFIVKKSPIIEEYFINKKYIFYERNRSFKKNDPDKSKSKQIITIKNDGWTSKFLFDLFEYCLNENTIFTIGNNIYYEIKPSTHNPFPNRNRDKIKQRKYPEGFATPAAKRSKIL